MRLRTLLLSVCLLFCFGLHAANRQSYEISFGNGMLKLMLMADNALRVQYMEGEGRALPEWIYLPEADEQKVRNRCEQNGEQTRIVTDAMSICVNSKSQIISVYDTEGQEVYRATAHSLCPSTVQGETTFQAELQIESPEDEYLYGLGQFSHF